MNSVVGVVLAAGAGRRMGTPKALMLGTDGVPWLHTAYGNLISAGCDEVVFVLGAEVQQAVVHVPAGARYVVASDWKRGVSASLASGLDALKSDTNAALITLVDLPGMPATVPQRVVAQGWDRSSLTRAGFLGIPGHPVLIGADHWQALKESLSGDAGAQQFLAENGVEIVECGDLWDGADVDAPASEMTLSTLQHMRWLARS